MTQALLTIIARRLDDLLRPAGFSRRGATWNPGVLSLTDVINVQSGKYADDATLNFGVFDAKLFAMCWDEPSPRFVQEP